jgi:hypothetical protein
MEKIELYLIAVGFLGLIIGWFISKEFFRKKDINRIESLSNTINEREIYLKNLENDCAEKQNKLDRLIDESILCKHELLQKSNLLRKKSDELYKIQKGLDNNSYDTQELQRLRMIIIKKDKLIENRKIENRKKDNSSYIEISKDQFQQIEKRLKEYKHKADTLEEENTRLSILNSSNKEFDFFKKVNYSISNMKAIALSNLFKDNYEKLIKA